LKKSEGYFFKEAQAAPLHERGPEAMSEKIILLLKRKERNNNYQQLKQKKYGV
jgi:hypothetical protein